MLRSLKRIFVFVVLALLLIPCVTAYALEPPYCSDLFKTSDDMLDSLKEYAEAFPNVWNHPQIRDGDSLEWRRVILPEFEGILLVSCHYSEDGWGRGANYFYFEFAGDIRIFVYYSRINAAISHNFFSKAKGEKVTTHEGSCNDTPYYARTSKYADGEIRTVYTLLVGELLINMLDRHPFSEERLGMLHFEETKVLLPVYVHEYEKPRLHHYYQALPRFYRWLCCGLTAILAVSVLFTVLHIIKKRHRQKNLRKGK